MHKHQRRILELLAHHDTVRFSDLERFFDLRSNKLSYHLNRLQDDGFVEKEDEKYRLTGQGKTVAPYLGRDTQPLTVVLVAPVVDGDVLLVKRKKEVYRGLYALPSKTVEYGETPEETLTRLQDEYGLELADVEYCNTVIEIDEAEQEHRQHHFVFLVYRATPHTVPNGMKRVAVAAVEEQGDVIPTDARIVSHLDRDGLQVMGMDVSDGLALRE